MPDVDDLLRTALGGERPPDDLFDRTLHRASRRERRRRVTAGAVALLAVLVVAVGLWSAFRTSDEGAPSVDRTPTASPSVVPTPSSPSSRLAFPPPFVPGTVTEDDTVRMPVTLPDGTTAVLVYPPSLRLAELGAQPEVGYYFTGPGGPGPFTIVFVHGHTTAGMVMGAEPVATYDEPSGTVELWEAVPGSNWSGDQGGYWLVSQLPSWTVLAYMPTFSSLGATIDGARSIAGGLRAQQTPDGFVAVSGTGPVEVSRDFGEGLGATLVFGDADPRESRVQLDEQSRMVTLHPVTGTCDPTDTQFPSACIGQGPHGSLMLDVNFGGAPFAHDVIEGLDAEDVRVPFS